MLSMRCIIPSDWSETKLRARNCSEKMKILSTLHEASLLLSKHDHASTTSTATIAKVFGPKVIEQEFEGDSEKCL